MTDSAGNDKPRKPGARRSRLVLYSVILLALLLWTRHENNQNDAFGPVPSATNLKQQAETGAENQRVKAAFALVKQAASTRAREEQLPIYDQIINTYQDDQAARLMPAVSWAMYKKGQAVSDPLEKSRLLDEVVDRYAQVSDKQVSAYAGARSRRS